MGEASLLALLQIHFGVSQIQLAKQLIHLSLPEHRVPNSIKWFEIMGLSLQEQNAIHWVYPVFQNPWAHPTIEELLHPGWEPQEMLQFVHRHNVLL